VIFRRCYMLQVSRATDYALLFLTNLVRQPDGRWNVREASETLNISRRFLANITHQLARNGIITTTKGSGGGMTLEREPDMLTIGEVVEAFEGPVNLVGCTHAGSTCDRGVYCSMQTYWSSLSKDINEALHRTTLEDLGENR
jgi:Rrf2 family protein